MQVADPSRKTLNQFAVFRLFLDGQARTREEAVAITGLSRSTIEKIFVALRAMGAIRGVGQRASRGGRPHELYGLDPSYRFLVTVDYPIPDLTVAVLDLANAVVCRRDTVIDEPHRLLVREAIEHVRDEVTACLATAKVSRDEVLSLSVSLPGPIIAGQSTIQNRDVADWVDVPLAEEFERRTGLRTIVVNDVVNMMTTELHARGEIGASVPRELSNTLFIALRRSATDGVRVGAAYAIPTGGKLQVFPGSITHYATGIPTAVCRCGNRGCLERAIQDLGPPPTDATSGYPERIAEVLTPVLHTLCRFTEARRVILDLTGIGHLAQPLMELVESKLTVALSHGPLHDTVVEAAVAPADASLLGAALNGLQALLSEPSPATAFFDTVHDNDRREGDAATNRVIRSAGGAARRTTEHANEGYAARSHK